MLVLFGISMLFVYPTTAQQQEDGMQLLSVEEAIRLAHQQHPALNQLREQIQMKRGERKSAFGIHNPTLSYLREGIGDDVFAEQRFSISQSVDFPLTSIHRVRQIDTQRDALELQLTATTRQITAEVKKAYTLLLYAQEVVHLREREVRLAVNLTEAAQIRVDVGEASELELIKGEIQRSEANSSLDEAMLESQNARYQLFSLIGIDPDQQLYSIQFPDTLVYIDAQISQADVMNLLDAQPELRSADKFLDASRAGVKKTRTTLLPSFQFDYYPQDFGAGYNRRGFQIGLRLPLWLNNYRGEMQVAKAALQHETWKKQAVYLDLKKRAEQAWHGYESSKRTIDRYAENVQARAETLLARTQEGYQLGEIELIILLDTQRTYLASELRYYAALKEYYYHLIDLEQFLGRDLVY